MSPCPNVAKINRRSTMYCGLGTLCLDLGQICPLFHSLLELINFAIEIVRKPESHCTEGQNLLFPHIHPLYAKRG